MVCKHPQTCDTVAARSRVGLETLSICIRGSMAARVPVLAGGQGLEPQLSHPECDVLPLYDPPIYLFDFTI